MKFVYVFAFLLGVILTHADDVAHPPESSSVKTNDAADASAKVLENGHQSAAPSGSANEKVPAEPKSPTSKPAEAPIPSHSESPGSPADVSPVPKSEQAPQKPELPVLKPSAPSAPITTSSTVTPIKPSNHTAGDWSVTEGGVTCIKIHGFISANVTLKNANHTETFTVEVLPEIKPEGSCKDERIRWNLKRMNDTIESLQFQFAKNKGSTEYYISRFDGKFFVPHTNHTIGFKKVNATAFKTPVGNSYFCQKSIKEELENNATVEIVLTMEDFQIQAFKTSTSQNFDNGIDGCPSGSHGTPDIVPIIVGCALALLVVVVLVAYLINRRRSQAHGYLSM